MNGKMIFEKAIAESNAEALKQAAEGMYQIFTALQKAGFDKQEAMTVMIAMTQNGKTKENDPK